MTLLWTTDPGAGDRLQYALGSGTAQVGTGAKALRMLEEDPAHDLVVIDADVPIDEACALAERQRLDHPELGVLLLRRRVDVTTLTQALRSGVREVVDADDTTAVASAARRSRDLTGQLRGSHGLNGHDDKGKVITIFSAKGGVGKTMLATNLAAHLASTGAGTLLVDLDMMFGDVPISFHLNPAASFADAIPMAGHLDAEGLAALVETHPDSHLDVLAAPSDPGQAERISAALVTELLRVARGSYRYIVVDTPPNISEHVLAAFDTTDVSVLVATLDIPAVKNLRIAISTLDTLGADQENRIVVLNRASDKVGLTAEDVQTALKNPVAHSIPTSLDVAIAANKGTPLALTQPKHPVSEAVRALADGVRAQLGEKVETNGKRRRLAWR